MSSDILLIGASGFTGQFLCRELLKRNLKFDCLVRSEKSKKTITDMGIDWVEGDLNDFGSLPAAFKGYKILVNVASLGFGAAPNIVKACGESGIKRAVFVSTTAVFTQLNAQSKKVRLAAEATIKNSSLDYTILRPTMIYGTPDDRNMCRLLKLLWKSPIIPIFGDGRSLQQPVHVEDVAWAIAEATLSPQTYRQEYNISGGQVLSYNDVIKIASKALDKRPFLLHIPKGLSIFLLEAAGALRIKTPVKPEQVARLNEDKVFDHAKATADFGYSPRSFADGISQEAKLFLKSLT